MILLRALYRLCEHMADKQTFVYLSADQETLLERVTQNSRKQTGKIQTREILTQTLQERVFGKIPFVENLVINTTHLSAVQVAQQMKKHYEL